MNDALAQSLLRELFDYREDGNLVWKVSHKGKGGNARIGKVAGIVQVDGRRRIQIDNKCYKAHRLIFLWHHGWMPKEIDHIDIDQSNNRIENLRAATRSQNNCNKRNVRGYTRLPSGKFAVQIMRNRVAHYLGTFTTETEARAAYEAGRRQWHSDVIVQ